MGTFLRHSVDLGVITFKSEKTVKTRISLTSAILEDLFAISLVYGNSYRNIYL